MFTASHALITAIHGAMATSEYLPVDGCDFESSTCSWTANRTAWRWRRESGAGLEASGELGPHQDHMHSSDKLFMLADATMAEENGDIAILASSKISHQVDITY
jgi:hypothetical protein